MVARTGNLDILTLLIEAKIDLTALDQDMKTAVHIAAEKNNLEMLKIIMEKLV